LNVCYEFARTGTCEAGSNCVYSHDSKLCTEFIAREIAKFNKSPFMKATPNSSQFNTPASKASYTPGVSTANVKQMELLADMRSDNDELGDN
jgi:hypothetical protein